MKKIPIYLWILFCCLNPMLGQAQQLVSSDFEYQSNPADYGKLKAVTEITNTGSSFIRLLLNGTQLDKNSYILLQPTEGADQKLGVADLEKWNYSSAFFNGDTVKVFLYTAPSEENLIRIDQIKVGTQQKGSQADDVITKAAITAASQTSMSEIDFEAFPHAKAVGRITNGSKAFGTGWIAPNGAIVTSELIRSLIADGFDIIEFNVPPNNPDGSLNHPGPEDQYLLSEVNQGYMALFSFKRKTRLDASDEHDLDISAYRTDWAIYEALPNHTGLRPGERQQAYFRVVNNPSSFVLEAIDVEVDVWHYGEPIVALNSDRFRILQKSSSRLLIQKDFIKKVRYLNDPVSLDSDDLLLYHLNGQGHFSGAAGAPITYKDENIALGVHHTTYPKAPAGALGFRDELLTASLGNAFGPNVTYVDAQTLYETDATGDVHKPFQELSSGVQSVPEGGIVFMAKGSYPETLTINKPLLLKAPVGKVVIGASSGNANSRIFTDPMLKKMIEENQMPVVSEILQNQDAPSLVNLYPNPFQDQTQISYSLLEESPVVIQVYDMIGSPIVKLVEEVQPEGNYQLSWNGYDQQGKALPPGMYIIFIQNGNNISQLKVFKE